MYWHLHTLQDSSDSGPDPGVCVLSEHLTGLPEEANKTEQSNLNLDNTKIFLQLHKILKA